MRVMLTNIWGEWKMFIDGTPRTYDIATFVGFHGFVSSPGHTLDPQPVGCPVFDY